MKKIIAFLLAFSMLSSNIWASDISVELDGEKVVFSSQEPVIVDGRTLIPLRGVFEQLGYEISWDGTTKTATFKNDENTILITAGSGAFIMNSQAIALDVPASIINGSMLLPLRAIGEAAGLNVDWNSETKTVILLSPSGEASNNESQNETTSYEEDMANLTAAAEGICSGYMAIVLVEAYLSAEDNRLEQISDLLSRTINSKEVYALIEEGGEACKTYKEAVNNLPDIKSNENIYNNVINVFDATEKFYDFLTDYIVNEGYRSMLNSQIESRQKGLLNQINKQIENLNNVISDTTYPIDSKYCYPYAEEDGLTDTDDYYAYANYLSDMGKTITSEMSETDLDNPDSAKIKAAADNIAEKLNSAETPETALFDKAIIYKACLNLAEASKFAANINSDDGLTADSIKYLCNFVTAELLFQAAVGSYYEPDYKNSEIDLNNI